LKTEDVWIAGDEIGFTQGLASFLPNGTFLQPPGHVHAMVSSSWQPNALATTVRIIEPLSSFRLLKDLSQAFDSFWHTFGYFVTRFWSNCGAGEWD